MGKIIMPLALVTLLFQGCSSESVSRSTGRQFTVPETEDIVMYEINIGSFSDNGNLQGITQRLDNIQSLGVNTIWLMPVFPIGEVNSFGSPYCVKNYQAINPELGVVQDLKTLVTEAHSKNIAVILDWVANHTAWDNPWISSHPNWYTHDNSGHIVSPVGTNWSDVADLDFGNAAMRLEMISSMDYWITEVGVDGFRCDAADLIPADFWQQAINSLQVTANRDIILLAEGSREDHFSAGFQMNFAWEWYNSLKNVFLENGTPQSLYNTNGVEYSSVPNGREKLRFTTNHDLSNDLTPIGVFGSGKAAIAASAVTIFMNGVPLIYSGQEVGVNMSSIYSEGQSIDWTQNPDILSAYTNLLQFYKNSEVAKRGTLTYISDPNVIVFEKTLGNDKLLIIINSRPNYKTLTIPSSLQGAWENALTSQAFALSGSLQIQGYEYLILKKV